jgi:hypothetical protein
MASPFMHAYTESERAEARRFAEQSKGRGKFYAAKRASRSGKTMTDIENGALGEFAARRLLCDMFGKSASVSEVDLEVYDVSQKSWDPDLLVTFKPHVGMSEPVRVHVKTFVCDRYPHIPPSWMFQKDGNGDQCDKDLMRIQPGGNATDWLVGVLGCVNDPKKRLWNGLVRETAIADYAVVYGPYQMQTIVDKELWREPEAETLQDKGNRRVLWALDLQENVPTIVGFE